MRLCWSSGRAIGGCALRRSARHFVPYWSQLLSREVQLGVADEIIARVHEKAAEIESGNSRDT